MLPRRMDATRYPLNSNARQPTTTLRANGVEDSHTSAPSVLRRTCSATPAGKKGHYARVCLSSHKTKGVSVNDIEVDASAIYLDTLDANDSETWYDTIAED